MYFIEEDVPHSIVSDVTRLRQVLVNLCNNAVKFTDQGEIYLNIRRQDSESGAELLFKLRVIGIGIPKEKLNKLFDSFTQVDASTTRRFGGTGLGLAICKKIVEAMGGHIWVESDEGEGTTFFFAIPLIKGSQLSAKKHIIDLHQLENKQLLLLDDNPTNLSILEKQLLPLNVKMRSTKSPIDALDWVVNEKGEFDLALVDMNMPEMDGLQWAKVVRKKYGKSELPVVVLSSIGNLLHKDEKADLNGYLTKPVSRFRLYKQVASALGLNSNTLELENEGDSTFRKDVKNISIEDKIRILVAEDNPINQKVIVHMLRKLCYEPILASNGSEAYELCEKIDFDLVSMDMEMPEMDGIEATRKILASSREKRPLIIAMTANAMVEDQQRCIEAGMNDFIAKPFTIQVVQKIINQYFSNG
ncbi:MAG: response regulator [Flavobacteriales bacterium]|nr:response regulator [Flavobacteriales bacterium]